MITLTTFGETPRVSQWLDAVRPNSTEILFSDRTQTRVQTTYSDDTHAASAVAAAVVAGVTVEKQERAASWLLPAAVVGLPAAWLAWKWWKSSSRRAR